MKLILTLIGAAALISCSSYEQVATRSVEAPLEAQLDGPANSGNASRIAILEEEILEGINDYRGTIGKSGLKRHRGLDDLAREHSEFMMLNAGKFNLEGSRISHYGFTDRATQAKSQYNMRSFAENVIAAWGIDGSMSDNFVQGWIDSPNHLHNIKGSWGHTGVGVAIGPDGAVYATQLFGLKSVSHHDKFAVPGVW